MSPFRGSAQFTKDWQHFRFEVDEEHVGTITFIRPEKLNALTLEVYADLRDLLVELPQRDDVRALIIIGTGRGFCSGGDVHEIIGKLLEKDTKDLLDFTRMAGAVIQRMRECPTPIIAAVNGVAALLPRLVGVGRATELLMLGEKLDAQRAFQIGLANAVVDDGALAGRAKDLARRLASGPTLAYATTKMLLSREMDMDLAGSLELEAIAQALLMKSQDHAEFYEAFQTRRDPKWTGR